MRRPGEGKFAILGLGSFGSTVALELERLGNEVLGVDRDEKRVNSIADQLTHAVIADVRDERALKELGLKDYDTVVVAIGEDLESNVICTMALKDMKIADIWVKALTVSHHRILARLGANRIINPEYEIGIHVANALNYPYVMDYISLGNDYFVVELEITDNLDGHSLAELDLEQRFEVRFLAVKRGRAPLDKEAKDIVLQKKDRLILMGALNNLRALTELL